MKDVLKKYRFLSKTALFIGIPLMIYFLQDFPRRTSLKEFISALTILSFSFMLSQFYFTRGYRAVEQKGKMSVIVKVHKFLGYTFTAILIVHPFLIVFPRYFEGGIKPMDALWQILTTFDNTSLILGMVAWLLMVILIVTSFFRAKWFSRYTTWRWFHGLLSLLFIGLAAYHVITLGRHSSLAMKIFYLIVLSGGVTVLIKTYVSDMVKKKGKQRWLRVKQELQLAEDNL